MPLSDEERRVIEEIERQFTLEAQRERSADARDVRRSVAGTAVAVLAAVVVLGVGFAVHPLLALAGAVGLFLSGIRLGAVLRESLPMIVVAPPRTRGPRSTAAAERRPDRPSPPTPPHRGARRGRRRG